MGLTLLQIIATSLNNFRLVIPKWNYFEKTYNIQTCAHTLTYNKHNAGEMRLATATFPLLQKNEC